MPFPQNFLDELLARSDIVDIVGSYVSLTPKGGSYWGCCPFHNEKTPSFHVLPDKQFYHCFGCKKGGGVVNFVMEMEGLTYPDAIRFLAKRANLPVPEESSDGTEKLRSRMLALNRDAARYYYSVLQSQEGAAVQAYLDKRRIRRGIAVRFGMGAAPDSWDALLTAMTHKGYTKQELISAGLAVNGKNGRLYDKFRNRLMLPVIDVRGDVVGFGSRVLDKSEPKYMNTPETLTYSKRRILYGMNLAKKSKRSNIILCEGNLDVVTLHQAGFDNAVASLGTALTSGHASLLKRYTNEVYLTYDSDGAGVKAALRAIPILKEVGITTKVINMRPYKDPDEFIKALGAQEYEERIKKAENSFMFQIRIMQAGYDMDDPESKTAFYNEIAKKLLGFTEELERTNYTQAVSREYSIPYDDLRKLVNSMAMKGGIVKPQTKLKSGINEKNKKEDGMKQSQKLLLTWLIEDNSLFDRIKGRISADDFTEELYHKVAKEVFSQYETTHTVNPARIVSMFTDEDEQREVAGLFNATIHQVEGKNDKATALRETVVRIKQNSIDYRSKHLAPTDTEGMMRIIEDKRALEELQKIPE